MHKTVKARHLPGSAKLGKQMALQHLRESLDKVKAEAWTSWSWKDFIWGAQTARAKRVNRQQIKKGHKFCVEILAPSPFVCGTAWSIAATHGRSAYEGRTQTGGCSRATPSNWYDFGWLKAISAGIILLSNMAWGVGGQPSTVIHGSPLLALKGALGLRLHVTLRWSPYLDLKEKE